MKFSETQIQWFFNLLDYTLFRVTMLVLAGIGVYKLIANDGRRKR